MSEGALKTEQTGDTLPATLRSQPHFEYLYWTFVLLSGVIAYVCLCFGVFFFSHEREADILKGITIFLPGCLGSLLLYLVAYIQFRPAAFLSVQLHPDHLIVDRDGHQTRAEYREITSMKFSGIPLFGARLLLLLQDGSKIRLPLTLLGLDRLADTLERFNAQRFPPELSLQLRKASMLMSYSASRKTLRLNAIGELLIKYIVFPASVGVLIPNCLKAFIDKDQFYIMWRWPWRYVTLPTIIACCLALFFGFLLNRLEDFIITRRERSLGLVDLEQDFVFEKKAQKIFKIIYYLAMTAFFTANFLIFTLSL